MLEPSPELGRAGPDPLGLPGFLCRFCTGSEICLRKPPAIRIEYESGGLVLEQSLGTVRCLSLLLVLPHDPGKPAASGTKLRAWGMGLRTHSLPLRQLQGSSFCHLTHLVFTLSCLSFFASIYQPVY